MRSTHRLSRLVLIALTAVAAVGCKDTLTQPDALLVAAETQAALLLSFDLPTIPALVDRAFDTGAARSARVDTAALSQARALWFEADAASGPGEARLLRTAARNLAAPDLLRALGPAGVDDVRARLERWVTVASGVLGETVPLGGIRDALDQGRVHLARARRLAAEGDSVEAMRETLAAADRLGTTTPGAVALRLIREADARLEAASGGDAASDGGRSVSIARARRLLRGAREALGNGEYALAIRRAYYAGRLLEERL